MGFRDKCRRGWFRGAIKGPYSRSRILPEARTTMTLSPVITPECVRTIIALAAKKNLKLHQMDIMRAFLNGTL